MCIATRITKNNNGEGPSAHPQPLNRSTALPTPNPRPGQGHICSTHTHPLREEKHFPLVTFPVICCRCLHLFCNYCHAMRPSNQIKRIPFTKVAENATGVEFLQELSYKSGLCEETFSPRLQFKVSLSRNRNRNRTKAVLATL